MRRVDWSPTAVRDLAKIRTYIAGFSPAGAKKMIAALEVAADRLAEQPHRGRPIAGGKRELATASPYLIRYRVMKGMVRIIRIRHAARRPL